MVLLHRTTCTCGKEITCKDIKPPLKSLKSIGITDVNFYGGNAKYVSDSKCGCGKEYILFLNQHPNGYKIVDMMYKNQPNNNPTDVSGMTRDELIKYAKIVGIQGKIATMKTESLREEILKMVGKVDG